MPDPRWAKIGRDLLAHKVRTLLTVLSIAVGVFAILVVLGGRGILIESFDENFPRSTPADATLYTSDFGDDLLRVAERQAGVRAADGRRVVTLRYLPGDRRKEAEPPSGVTLSERSKSIDLVATKDWAATRVERVFPDPGTAWPPSVGEVVLERSAVEQDPPAVGDLITVDTASGDKRVLRVSGFAHDINAVPAMFTGRIGGFVRMDEMPLLGQPAEYNRMFVSMNRPELTRDEASRIATRLGEDVLSPRGVRVYGTQVPEPGSHFLGDIFRAVAVLLLALGVMALMLSGFLVVNTVSALVSQQIRQIGVMKAVGGRSAQIQRMYLTLVAAYGVLAVGIGLPLGSWVADEFAKYAGGVLNFGTAPSGPPGYAVALAIAVGLVVPLAAAYLPVRQGTRVSVVRALNSTGMSPAGFGHGLVDRVLGLVKGLPRPVALALRNTFLRKGRLAMTLATLTLASAVVMSVMTVRTSILHTVSDVSSWWRYDAEVTFQQPVSGAAVEREAIRTPGITAVESWIVRQASLKRPGGTANDEIGLVGMPARTTFVSPRIVAGRWLAAGDKGAVVVNSDVANDEDVQVGDTRTFTVMGKDREWKVVGIVQGQLVGSSVFVERDYLENVLAGAGGVGRVVVRTADHTEAGQRMAGDRLETRLKDAGFVVSGVRYQKTMSSTLASELGILVTFLIIMATILAAVGIIGLSGTMIINVLESTREIGVMRAIGASHGSIYQVFVTEGVVIGVLSWALGAAITYPLSLGLVRMLERAITIPLTYDFSWSGILLWLAIVSGISAVASLLPAFRASQVSVRDAIAYE